MQENLAKKINDGLEKLYGSCTECQFEEGHSLKCSKYKPTPPPIGPAEWTQVKDHFYIMECPNCKTDVTMTTPSLINCKTEVIMTTPSLIKRLKRWAKRYTK